MSDFKELVKNLYTSKDRELTPEKFEYIQKTYSNGKEQEFVKNFYATIGEDLTEEKLTYISDTYLKKKDTPSQSSATQLPLPNQPINPLQQGANIVGGGVIKQVSKGIPQSIGDGVSRDKKKKNNWLDSQWNLFADMLSSTVAGLTSFQQTRANAGLERAMQMSGETEERKKQIQEGFYNKGLEDKVREKAESALRSKGSTKEEERAMTEFDISDGLSMSDVGGILNSAPSQIANMGLGAITMMTNYAGQIADESNEELKKSPEYNSLSESDKMLYMGSQMLTQTLLEKLPIGILTKKTGLSSTIKNAITNKVLKQFRERGLKASTQQLEAALTAEVSSFAKMVKRVGVGAAMGAIVEPTQEALQAATKEGVKIATNRLKDRQVFDEKEIKQNFWKNVGNAAVAALPVGLGFGAGAARLNNTKKAVRKEISKQVGEEGVQKSLQEINTQVESGNLTPQEAQVLGGKVQEYAEIAGRIPKDLNEETKYAIIGGIEQRNEVQAEIEKVKQSTQGIDEAFLPEKQAEINVLEGKLGQINDYLEGIVSDKGLPNYVQEGDKFYKVLTDGRQSTKTEITKEHFDIAQLVKNNEDKKQKQKSETEINDFAERIASGEEMQTPEDLQFYENNKEAIEKQLKEKQKEVPKKEVMGSSVGGDLVVTEESKQALRDIIQLTDSRDISDFVANGDWNGEGDFGFDINGNVVLTRFADSREGLTKSGNVTSPDELKRLMNNYGGEQIPTSGVAGGMVNYQSSGGNVTGVYRIPLEEFKKLIKEGYVQFAGFGNKEFVLSPHIADKYLTEVNGKQREEIQQPIVKAKPIKEEAIVSDLVDKKVELNGKVGLIKQDEGGKITFENNETIIELQGDETAKEITTPKIQVKDNNVTIDNDSYEFVSTNKDENGNVVSVTLKDANGRTITKRDADLALDIAIAKNNSEFDSQRDFTPQEYETEVKGGINVEFQKEFGGAALQVIESMPDEVADTFAAMEAGIVAMSPNELQQMVITSTEWVDKAKQEILNSKAPQKEKNDAIKMLDKFNKDLNKYYEKVEKQRKGQDASSSKAKPTKSVGKDKQKTPTLEFQEEKQEHKEEKVFDKKDLDRAKAKKVHQRVREMEAPSDAAQIALRYIADGGKVSEAAINEVAGTVKRARLNTGAKDLKSNEAKSRDYYQKDGETLDELAHRLWENSGQEVSEIDIKDALMGVIGDYNTRLEAGTAYLEQYNAEYQEEKYYERLAEQYKEEFEEEQRKIEELFREPLEEELLGLASEEHINNLIKQYENELNRENQELRPEGKNDANEKIGSRASGKEDGSEKGKVGGEPIAEAKPKQEDVERELIIKKAKGNDSLYKAPNGKKSNLSNDLWVLVRTKQFKEKFGDWEVGKSNVLKDENGEPMKVYHGTSYDPKKGMFAEFDKSKNKFGYTFFSSNRDAAIEWSKDRMTYTKTDPYIVEAFISLENPVIKDYKGGFISDEDIALFQKSKEKSYVIKNVIDTAEGKEIVNDVYAVNNENVLPINLPNLIGGVKENLKERQKVAEENKGSELSGMKESKKIGGVDALFIKSNDEMGVAGGSMGSVSKKYVLGKRNFYNYDGYEIQEIVPRKDLNQDQSVKYFVKSKVDPDELYEFKNDVDWGKVKQQEKVLKEKMLSDINNADLSKVDKIVSNKDKENIDKIIKSKVSKGKSEAISFLETIRDFYKEKIPYPYSIEVLAKIVIEKGGNVESLNNIKDIIYETKNKEESEIILNKKQVKKEQPKTFLEEEYEEVTKKKGEKAQQKAKEKLIEDNFKGIVAQLMTANKIKRRGDCD